MMENAMSLPRNVQRQVDAAKAAQEMYHAELENPDDPALEQEPAPPAEPEPQPVEVPKPEPAKEEERESAYWKHRFDVLQGKYNAEVPALRKEISTLQEQIKAAESKAGDSVSRAQEAVADLTEEEIEEFGPDLISLIKRVAGSSVSQPNTEIDEMKERLRQLDEERTQDLESRFWATLEVEVPDFRQVNANPEFHAWLASVDEITGATRQELLVTAQQAWDPLRVIAIFKQFKGQPSNASQKQRIPEDQVQPRASKSGGADGTSQYSGRIWTRQEINEFYRDRAAGRISGEQAIKDEEDIFNAQREGRIR